MKTLLIWLTSFTFLAQLLQPESASHVIESVNSREIGSPGLRRVKIELLEQGISTRVLQVINVWKRDGQSVKTLFALELPTGLRGISYLMEENLPDQELLVSMFLPAGKRQVLQLTPATTHEGLLGSDFSYDEMRWTLPNRDVEYVVRGKATCLHRPAILVDMKPNNSSLPWSQVRLSIDDESRIIVAADYYLGGQLQKSFRVIELDKRGNTWTPTVMEMQTGTRTTRLSLVSHRFNVQEPIPEPDVSTLRSIAELTKSDQLNSLFVLE